MNLPVVSTRVRCDMDEDVVPLSILQLQHFISGLRPYCLLLAICLALMPIRFAFAGSSPQSTDSTSGVELCYYADGPGKEISGEINGRPFTNHARIFRVTVDGTAQDAFCTDLYNPIGTKQCHSHSQIGVTDPMVACVLQQYPPSGIDDDDEAAAVQSAIWHFSDGFELSPSESIFGQYQSIISDVETKYANNACAPVDNYQLSVDVENPVHFLRPNAGAFGVDENWVAIQLLGSDRPVANQMLQVSTDLGTLSWAAEAGQQIVVQTDQNGRALVAIAHDRPGKATVDVSATVQLPMGTRIDPGPSVQKLVVSGTDAYRLRQQQQVEWVAGEKLVVKKFHDINRDGLFNHTDELIDWTVEVCEAGTDSCFVSPLGESGSRVFALDPQKRYDVCEILEDDWVPTTPACVADVELPTSLWFGNVQTPSLLIEKFHDLNGNGIQDSGEPGIVGWPFQVLRQNGVDWMATYSGNTGLDGRLGYSNVGFHTYQVNELFPSGETWYASTPESQTVRVNDKQTYTVTFGNLKPAMLTVEKTWLVDSIAVTPPEGTMTSACIRRVGPGQVNVPILPTVNGAELIPDHQGFYCYEQLVDSATFENIWPGEYEIIEKPPGSWTPITIPEALMLTSDQHFRTAGFVNSTTTAAIGDIVWFDRNQNGFQDSGERGVADVVVRLFTADGSEVAQTSTDNVGQYIFTELMPGGYYLRFEAPDGYLVSPQNQVQTNSVDSDAIDSDIEPTSGETVITELTPGEYDMSWDAGIFKPTAPSFIFEKYINGNEADSIGDAVITERNQLLAFRYEIINDGDTPLMWSELIDDVFGDLTLECRLPIEIAVGRTEACSITRLAGNFPSGKVNIGTVSLSEAPPPDQPDSQVATLPQQSDLAWYITEAPPNLATLGDRVWLDENENGLQDNGEPGVASVQVMLLDENGNSLGRTTGTNDDGLYLFEQLLPGNYIVEFSIPYGYALTQPLQGADVNIDSNPSLSDIYLARTPLIELAESETNLSIDAGLIFSPPALDVEKVPTVSTVNPGGLLTYTVVYENTGDAEAIDVNIVEEVPQNTTFDEVGSSDGWECTGDDGGNICIYHVGRVPGNFVSSEPLLFVVRVNDPLPLTVTQIVNLILIRDDGAPIVTGIGEPPVFVRIEHVVLGTPPTAEPNPNQPSDGRLPPAIYLPFVD